MANTPKRRSSSTGKHHKFRPPAAQLHTQDVAIEPGPWLTLDDLDYTNGIDGLTDGQRNGLSPEEFAVECYFHRYTRPSLAPVYPDKVEELRKRPSRLNDPDFDYGFEPEFVKACEASFAKQRKSMRDSGWVPDQPTPEQRRRDQRRRDQRAMAKYRREEIARYTKEHPNWQEEERQEREAAQKESEEHVDIKDNDNVRYFADEKAKREDAKANTNADEDKLNAAKDRIKEKLKEKKLHLFAAEAFFKIMDHDGDDLKVVKDKKGVEVMWSYDHVTALWSIVLEEVKFLERKLQKAITELGARHKTSVRLLTEARKLVMTDPRLHPVRIAFDAHAMIPVKENLIDPVTLIARPITKEDYCTWTLDITFDPAAECPWWQQMLADTFADRTDEERKERIDLLQDFMGAGLIDNKNKALRRAMVIIGDSNSGKSALLDVMSEMFTDDPITTPIADLTKNHGTQAFMKRSAWILNEAFDQGTWHISSKAKEILGGDFFEVNPKGRAAVSVTFTGPTAWATNHPPKFREATKAMITRMILLQTSNIFDEDNEIGAAAEARKRGYQEPQEFVLKTEKSGILNWMLIGAKRAIENKRYFDTEEGKEALHEVRLDSNMTAGFVEDCIDFDPNVRMPIPDFNGAFMSWWKENRGDERTVSPDQIGRALKALSHNRIATDRQAFRGNKDLRYYCGIKFNDAGKAHWENTADALSVPGYKSQGDLSRMSTDFKNVTTPIPPEWQDHPAIIKIRTAAARGKTRPKM